MVAFSGFLGVWGLFGLRCMMVHATRENPSLLPHLLEPFSAWPDGSMLLPGEPVHDDMPKTQCTLCTLHTLNHLGCFLASVAQLRKDARRRRSCQCP